MNKNVSVVIGAANLRSIKEILHHWLVLRFLKHCIVMKMAIFHLMIAIDMVLIIMIQDGTSQKLNTWLLEILSRKVLAEMSLMISHHN